MSYLSNVGPQASCLASMSSSDSLSKRFGALYHFLADVDRESWPALYRLETLGVRTGAGLRIIDSQVLLHSFADLKYCPDGARIQRSVLACRANLLDISYIYSRWHLFLSDCLSHINSVPAFVLGPLRRMGLFTLEHIASLSNDIIEHIVRNPSVPILQSADSTREGLFTIRKVAKILVNNRSSSLTIPPHLIREDPFSIAVTPSFPASMWAVEALAAGYPLNLWHVAQSLHDVFAETSRLKELRLVPGYGERMSWATRCFNAGLPWLSQNISLDSCSSSTGSLIGTPREIINTMKEARTRTSSETSLAETAGKKPRASSESAISGKCIVCVKEILGWHSHAIDREGRLLCRTCYGEHGPPSLTDYVFDKHLFQAVGPRDPPAVDLQHKQILRVIQHQPLGPQLRARETILAEAGIRAMMASFKGSWASVASGMRCFAAFLDELRPGTPHLPANDSDILAWSAIFHNGGTLANYIGSVLTAHTLTRIEHHISPEILRRLRAGRRKIDYKLSKQAIRGVQKMRMVEMASSEGDLQAAALWSLAFDRLFRVQSELLPLERRSSPPADMLNASWHSAVVWDLSGVDPMLPDRRPLKASIHLRRRKNNPMPTVMELTCHCPHRRPPHEVNSQYDSPCALCRLRDLWTSRSDTMQIFSISKTSLLTLTKKYALLSGSETTRRLGLHVFRRGACQDLVNKRTPLSKILDLGGWKSSAALHYMAMDDLENRNYALVHADNSDSEAETQ